MGLREHGSGIDASVQMVAIKLVRLTFSYRADWHGGSMLALIPLIFFARALCHSLEQSSVGKFQIELHWHVLAWVSHTLHRRSSPLGSIQYHGHVWYSHVLDQETCCVLLGFGHEFLGPHLALVKDGCSDICACEGLGCWEGFNNMWFHHTNEGRNIYETPSVGAASPSIHPYFGLPCEMRHVVHQQHKNISVIRPDYHQGLWIFPKHIVCMEYHSGVSFFMFAL